MSGPNSPIKVGFVGLSATGWASIALFPSFLKPAVAAKYTITALSTRSPESAEAAVKKYSEQLGHPVKAYHGDTGAIARDPDVDLVVVSVKAPAHKAALLPVIEAGKDFFVEWPAGSSLKETEAIAEAARRKGVRSIVGLQGRHPQVTKTVKDLIESGKIGKVLSTSIIALAPRELRYWGPETTENSAYAADPSAGASMLDIAIGHQIDIVTHVLGDFASISATGTIHYPTATVYSSDPQKPGPTGRTVPMTGYDHIAISGQLASGTLASIVWRAGQPTTPGRRQLLWEIDGEEGTIRLESDVPSGAFMQVRDPRVYVNGERVGIPESGAVDYLAGAWTAFAEGGQYATIEDAVKLRRLLEAISTSAKEGRRVDLSADK